VLVTADEVKKGKPDPEPYLKGAQLLGFDPVDCLVMKMLQPEFKAPMPAG